MSHREDIGTQETNALSKVHQRNSILLHIDAISMVIVHVTASPSESQISIRNAPVAGLQKILWYNIKTLILVKPIQGHMSISKI